MLSIDPIVHVTVTASSAAASPTVFDTPLLLAPLPEAAFREELRLLSFESAARAAEELSALGFAEDSVPVQTARKVFGASPAPSRLLCSLYPAEPETPAEALEAVLERTSAFYGLCLAGEETPETLCALARAVEAAEHPMVLFVPVTGSVAEAAAPGGLLSALRAASLSRVFAFFAETVSDIGAVLGTAMGLEQTHPDTAFSLCYKSVAGIAPADLTASQVRTLKDLSCNVYLTRGYTHRLLEPGCLSGGTRYDERLYLDRIASDLQEAAVALLAENPDRLPQTDDASAQFINRFSSVLIGYTTMGVLATAAWRGADAGPLSAGDPVENGFALWADPYDDQSDADRAARRAMPVHVALTLAGSLESVVIAVRVQG